eukprot:CFRG4358T1
MRLSMSLRKLFLAALTLASITQTYAASTVRNRIEFLNERPRTIDMDISPPGVVESDSYNLEYNLELDRSISVEGFINYNDF